ncbi:MAG: tetratricopeptide repeat protein [Phycisphaerae bacterium]|nr:tetratricopeptide repeat protein [Phycisphaerae bacterium]
MKDQMKASERLTVREIVGDLTAQDVAEWTQLATALMRSEKYQEAVELLYVAIQCDPEAGKAWFALGLCYYNLGRLTEAQEALEIARCNGGPVAQIDACLRRLAVMIRAEKEKARRRTSVEQPEVNLAEADHRAR